MKKSYLVSFLFAFCLHVVAFAGLFQGSRTIGTGTTDGPVQQAVTVPLWTAPENEQVQPEEPETPDVRPVEEIELLALQHASTVTYFVEPEPEPEPEP